AGEGGRGGRGGGRGVWGRGRVPGGRQRVAPAAVGWWPGTPAAGRDSPPRQPGGPPTPVATADKPCSRFWPVWSWRDSTARAVERHSVPLNRNPDGDAPIEPTRYLRLGTHYDVSLAEFRFSDVSVFIPALRWHTANSNDFLHDVDAHQSVN